VGDHQLRWRGYVRTSTARQSSEGDGQYIIGNASAFERQLQLFGVLSIYCSSPRFASVMSAYLENRTLPTP
jgi:hypothetical protein